MQQNLGPIGDGRGGIGTCPIEKAVGEVDSRANEGMDQGLDG